LECSVSFLQLSRPSLDDVGLDVGSEVRSGAVVLEGTIVEEGSIYAGVPAKKVKTISEELINGEINRISNNYVQYASWFSGHNDAPKTK
jgi:carbonic anhydrase/acetyltransferase-like protein (isoleucine patch superfamily)